MKPIEIIAKLREMAESHWMMARQQQVFTTERQQHACDAIVLEAAIEEIDKHQPRIVEDRAA